ncbi:cytochrome C biogenesis protein [Microbacterium sp. HD4P20]|uniref:cytochrome c biogenesis CcdA family protein n=1 Tax=Microbacterium sp. HD4P20 TaxID=2864874 RepID=UPI001C643E34|nr:cytochrome c biogenesis protein CcdA [Microbacterium sp. HD4P20]MCP2638471.1 cytochrome C biogenesis protein [Microbacterium sp. HD4P20]
MLALTLVSFAAGVLTVLAPCVLPLLPVIVGGTAVRAGATARLAERQWFRPLVIAASLAISVVVFTLLLKATTALLGVPAWVWQVASGTIVAVLGVAMLFPGLWERVTVAAGWQAGGGRLLDRGYRRGGLAGDIAVGAALGPAFSSCSPTYALIVATVLPASFAAGVLYVSAYAIGLALALLGIALAGTALVRRLGWLSDPHGVFRRVVGGLLILVGLGVALGWDRLLQAWVLEQGWYGPIENLEHMLLG